MKRFLALILTLLYLGSSTGAVIHVHYCMGKLSSWSWKDPKNRSCEVCGMPKQKSHGCCKDVQEQIKVSKDHQAPLNDYGLGQFMATQVFYAPVSYETTLIHPGSPALAFTATSSPPGKENGTVFLRNCVFRI